MTTFILTIVISALAGGACGYLLARHIWQDRLIEMEEKRQELRRKRLELHRERFQESTSRIHRPTTTEAPQSGPVSQELEQLRLEMMLLKEDHRVETEVLKREIQQLKPDDNPLYDAEETEAVIIEADDEYAPDSMRTSEETDGSVDETDDVIVDAPDEEDIDAVFGSTHVEGPSTDEAASDESPKMETPEAPTVEPAAETIEESSDVVEEDAKPTPQQKEEPSRSSLIAPVPTDIESLFKAPRVEEPEVAPEKKPEKAAKQEDAPIAEEPIGAEPPVVDEPVEAVEAVPEPVAEEPAEQAEAPVADEPVIAAEVPTEAEPALAAEAQVKEEPAATAEAPTEDEPAASEEAPAEAAPAAPKEDEVQPFAIHWNADRPGRRKDLTKPSSDQPDDVHETEDHNSEPAIPVFRSLHDMLVASGVSLAADEPVHEDAGASEPTWSPKFASQETAPGSAATDKALIRSIVSLDAESFSLLDELGYASLTRLAQLSPSEIRRLAQVFRINPEQIEQDWKPTATAHLNMKSSG